MRIASPSPPGLRRASRPRGIVATASWRPGGRSLKAWTRRLAVFFTLACLVVVASAAPLCELACAFDGSQGTGAGHAHMHAHAGTHRHVASSTPHDASGGLHAGGCHLAVAAAMPAPEQGLGYVDPPILRASLDDGVIASLDWPPPERPPKARASS